MSTTEIRRLFFALWPSDEVRSAVAGVQDQLHSGSGRLVSRENLHVTLVFLGAADEASRRCVQSMAGAAYTGARFGLVLNTLGYWRKPQVLWLGGQHTPEALLMLVAALQQGAERCGFAVECRPYEAHLTLSHKVERAPQNISAMVTPIAWPVTSFCLVESVLHPEGTIYEVLQTWDLR